MPSSPSPSKPFPETSGPSGPRPAFQIFVHPTYGVFTSPNTNLPPPFPLAEAFSSLKSTQSPCHADNCYPFLPMVPTSPQFDDLLLGDLHLKPGKVFDVKKQQNGEWRLASDTVMAWKRVEQRLIFLLNRLKPLHQLIHLDEDPLPPTPTRFGYQNSHRSSGAALVAVKHSHLAFHVLMGHISYYIAYGDQRSTHNDKLRWEIQLSRHNPPVDHNVVDLIQNSELNDFSSSYAWAGIVLYPDCQFLRCIHMFVKCWVPVWIFWGGQILFRGGL